MSEDKRPKGPDLIKGVPSSNVEDGAVLAGRVGDEVVLITRQSDALYALGATCTHYQGPLAEGFVHDGTLRCPWHHARFCLKTGEAVGAPAIDPVACYSVEEKNGTITVTGKKDVKPETLDSPDGVRRVVIVGGGAGGFAAAEMLRRKGYEGGLTILSQDKDPPYDRPNCSKDYLAGEADSAWMPLRDKSYYKEQKVDLRLKTEVERLDLKARSVTVKGGDTLTYDALILATGAKPQRPSIPGFDGDNVYVLRSLRDADAIIAAAEKATTVAVIGSSFIGLEVAAALKTRKLDVHVIAPEQIPFEKVLGTDIGEWVLGEHKRNGVVFHLGRKVTGYADGAVTTDHGDPVKADFVVLGLGVKPRTEIAKAAGMKLDEKGGVLVDDRLRAAEGVYAVGDIAAYPDPVSGQTIRVEHWVHAERQGQHVARIILGEDEPYAEPPFFWSAHYGTPIRYIGHAEGFDRPMVKGNVAKADAEVDYAKGDKLVAVATLNRDDASLKAEAKFEDRSRSTKSHA